MTVDNKTTADPINNTVYVQTGSIKLAALQRLHDAVVAGTFCDGLAISIEDGEMIEAAIPTPEGGVGTWETISLIMDGSLDAAKALHEAMVPGWAIDRMAWWPGGHWAFHLLGTGEPDHNGDRWHGHADGSVEASDADPARAWTLAIIKALIAQEGE